MLIAKNIHHKQLVDANCEICTTNLVDANCKTCTTQLVDANFTKHTSQTARRC